MKIGFIGLGRMGSNMVLRLLEQGVSVVAWNRSEEPIKNLESRIPSKGEARQRRQNSELNLKFIIVKTVKDLVQQLEKPRVVWLMVSAGEATEEVLREVSKFAEKGDIVIDGGNAYYKDTEKRYQELKKREIRYLGIGVSGGIIAAESGYPLMAGGDRSAYEYVRPILDSLAKPNGGHEYFGTGGAGHFVKMVHNGIEYGIMQALGEGFEVLEKAPYNFDLLKIAKLYQKGTLVSGFMLDRVVDALVRDPKLSSISGYIEESGEARWTVEQAKEEGVAVEIIERSLEYRRRSQKETKIQNSFAAKLIAALRQAFGGHPVKKK